MNGMHLTEGPMSDYEKKEKQRQEAMKKRLESLPQDNPVVKTSIKKIEIRENRTENREKWEVVEDLFYTASSQFSDGDLSFEDAVKSLSEALLKLIKK